MEGGELLRLSPISHASDCLCGDARARTHARTHTLSHAQVAQQNVRIHSVTVACVTIQSSFLQRLKPFVNRVIINVAAPSSC